METFYPPQSIHISDQNWQIMLSYIQAGLPEEACGMLLGKSHQNNYQTLEVHPTTNILHNPVRYQMDPQEQLEVINYMQEKGLELVAIYHSHPQGQNTISQIDIEEAFYHETVYLIWFAHCGEWQCRAYLIQDGSATEIQIWIN